MAETPGYYIYLISSLPMLHFGAKPPFSFERFLEICSGLISDKDIEIIKRASKPDDYTYDSVQPTLKKWHAFDTALRNELVRIRASRRRLDPFKYLRGDASRGDSAVMHIAMSAYRTPSIIEAERVLDRERWRLLDELCTGHYFDIDFLILYAHKLLILERWERIHRADKSRVLEETLRKS